MEFPNKQLRSLPETKVRGWNGPLPFYMLQTNYRDDKREECLRDLEYLQQLYPAEIRRCKSQISKILDYADYEGSMIYDEYPDRMSLYRLTELVCQRINRDFEEENKLSEELIQILLFDEIYKRRHGGNRAGTIPIF